MKKFILNIVRRACGTAHLIEQIEQLKKTITDKNTHLEQLTYQINCNLIQLMTKTDKRMSGMIFDFFKRGKLVS